MQTLGSQSEQTSKKIAPSVWPLTPPRRLENSSKFRLWLSFTVFYPYVLVLALFAVLLIRYGQPSKSFISNAVAIFLATTGLFGFSIFLINAVLKERRLQRRELSRATCLTAIVDVFAAASAPLRDKVKRVGRLLAREGDPYGWRCRVVLQEDASFLPPNGSNLGFHWPLTAGGKNVGILIVTSTKVLDGIERRFFETLARTLGHFLYNEKLWRDFNDELGRFQASLLLNTAASPTSRMAAEERTVEQMLRTVGVLQGKVENSVDNKL